MGDGGGVGHAVTVVEVGRVPSAPKAAPGLRGYLNLLGGERHHVDPGSAQRSLQIEHAAGSQSGLGHDAGRQQCGTAMSVRGELSSAPATRSASVSSRSRHSSAEESMTIIAVRRRARIPGLLLGTVVEARQFAK